MRVPILLIGVAIVLCAPPLQAEQSPRAAARRHVAVDRDRMAVDGGIRVVFSAREVEMIREHYAPRYANLPPGLQKKLARTGQLPPGWQKKMKSFPVALTRRLSSLPDGYARGVIDGRAVIYVPGTSLIIDATVLF